MLPGTSWPEQWKRNIWADDSRWQKVAKHIMMMLGWLYLERVPWPGFTPLKQSEGYAKKEYLRWKASWKIHRKKRWQHGLERFLRI